MRTLFVVLLTVCAVGCTEKQAEVAPAKQAEVTPAKQARFTRVELKRNEGALGERLKREAARAVASGQKPFVYVHAEWCPPCKAIEETMDGALMSDAFAGTYVIGVDFDDWESDLDAQGMGSQAIPAFFQLSKDGKATGRKIDGGAWGDNVPENMAPPLKRFFNGS